MELLTVRELESYSSSQIEEVKFRCQTDLFWFADSVLRNDSDPPLGPHHRRICGTFLQPNPKLPFEEWSDIKTRVCLSYRGSQKSTLSSCSIVQQILAWPQIRILILSGKQELAETILKTVRGHFLYNETMEFLFPDFCHGIDARAESFNCPLHDPRLNHREETVQVGTFGTTKAGGHFAHLVADDCVSEQNQRTRQLVDKSIADWQDLRFLKLTNAYSTFIATRWAAAPDIATVIKTASDVEEERTGKKTAIYLSQPVWKVKTCSTQEQQKTLDELEAKGRLTLKEVELTNPNMSGREIEELFKSYRDDRKSFYAHMLLAPEAVSTKIFPRHLLQRQVRGIQAEPPPHQSSFVVNCDLAGLSGKSDFSCLIGGYFNLVNGQLFVRKMILERFERTFDLITAILLFYQEFDGELGGFRIENSTVTSFLREPLEERAKTMQWLSAFNILWETPERIPNAKAERIFGLKNAIANDKIHFWEGLDNLEELFRQLESFDGKKCVGKDDAADCLAQLWQRFSKSVFPPAILPMRPSAPPVIWTNSDTSLEASLPDANELSAAQDAVRYTMPTRI